MGNTSHMALETYCETSEKHAVSFRGLGNLEMCVYVSIFKDMCVCVVHARVRACTLIMPSPLKN